MVDVLIVNWNTKDKLRACLTSLQVQSLPPNQIIVVDNASTDGSAEMVRTEFPNVKLFAENHNHGYAQGNNIAFKSATSNYVLTLNPDTELPPDNLADAVKTLDAHPECAALSVKFIGPQGETQASVRGFPTITGILGALLKLDRLFPHSAWAEYTLPQFDYNKSQHCFQPMGTYILFERTKLAQFANQLEPFDQQFPIYFNEVDLLYRLHQAGFKVWYESSLSIFHHHGASTKQVRKSMIWESHLSLVRYFVKHAAGFERLALPLIAVAAIVGASIRARGFSQGFRAHDHNL
jgi:hypothetical protein